jgi:BirA family biotin operon repressor/biotin-[acetyl-CoA-carboxylase] ligase
VYKYPAKTLFVGKKLDFLPTCHSTNEVAYDRMREHDLQEGYVIITNKQTKGRGQMGNSWESEPGKNLTLSVVLKPHFIRVEEQFRLTQAVSLGIVDMLSEYGNSFSVKWPNDIYYEDQKICGILIQNVIRGKSIDYSIVGIGLNVNQSEFNDPKAVSLKSVTGDDQIDLNLILIKLLHRLEMRYLQLRSGKYDQLHTTYLDHLYRFGEDHLFRSGELFSGRIVDVLPSGMLIIDTKNGQRNFMFKEVQFV